MMFVCGTFLRLVFLPSAPTSDADALHDVDAELTDVHEEEDEEPERAVAPAERGTEASR